MNLKEIKSYDDSYWLHHLKDRTIFDTDNIKAQKEWLIERLEQAEIALTDARNVLSQSSTTAGLSKEVDIVLRDIKGSGKS